LDLALEFLSDPPSTSAGIRWVLALLSQFQLICLSGFLAPEAMTLEMIFFIGFTGVCIGFMNAAVICYSNYQDYNQVPVEHETRKLAGEKKSILNSVFIQ
jgi:hypothetical protein